MSVNIGIIGPGMSGKTTIFNALTRGAASRAESMASHVGVARVPEPRLKLLADLLHFQKTVPVEVRYTDVSASVKGLSKDKVVGGEFLAQLSTVDAIICVVRAFTDETVPHPAGSIDVHRDIAEMELELAFSDLAIIERRMDRLGASLKGVKAPERDILLHEKDVLLKLRTELEKEVPVRNMALSPAEVKLLPSYQFLTAKPMLVLANVGEDQLGQAAALEADLTSHYGKPGCRAIALCGKLEAELALLDEGEAIELRSGYGIKEAGADRIVRVSYDLLGLITFFTVVSNEVRAWSVHNGASAVRAAGKIHTDMERGFIRAEVIGCNDLVKLGSLAEAKKKGQLRLEGKDYTIKDGDVITFLFNV